MANHNPTLSEMLPNLPEEMLNEIFSRMPLKSIGKLRCLSKTWHTRLSTSHFINSHISHNTHKESLILLTNDNSLHVIKLPIENPTISKELELRNSWNKVLGSCNGLVLLLNWHNEMFLVNPSTIEQFKVPKLTFDSKKVPETMLCGFGYDSSSDDYKIVVISHLYSVRSGVWRRINHSLYWFAVCGSSRGAFTNGSLHWFVNWENSRTSFGILAFNLSTELFSEVDIPLDFFGPDAACEVLSHEGCLCLMNPLWTVDSRSSGKIDVWTMKEYGMPNSWSKLGNVDNNGKWDTCVPLCVSRDEEILLLTCVSMAVGNNLEELTITCEHTMVVHNLQEAKKEQ